MGNLYWRTSFWRRNDIIGICNKYWNAYHDVRAWRRTWCGYGVWLYCIKFCKVFSRQERFIGGIATASYGISSVLVPIIANALIDHFNVTTAFKLLGGIMLVIICISAFFISACPKDFKPDGWNPPTPVSGGKAAIDKNWKAMLKDSIFYVMILMLCCGAFSGLMITSQASPLAQQMIGMTAAEAAVVVSILALLNTSGRILAGVISR